MTLTRDQVLEIDAGSEMDELVATLVMGRADNRTVWGEKVFSPSTKLTSAWEVVEKMHENRFLFDISTSVGAGYTARFYNRDTEVFHNAHYIESAPLAICRAALLATLKEENT